MLCPYCQKEMVLGYIQCRDGLHWTPRRQPVAALSCFGRGSVPLSNGAADNSRTVFAHRCAACQKIIIDCSEHQRPIL
ncbi:MAG: hypothetical protein E7469_01995 [Ruminococcaceae bacterium]|nr:hypothetical protein [Oscillospiraceae bacterium]